MSARLLTFERDGRLPQPWRPNRSHSTIDEEAKSLTLWKF
jgi:hypothetical protein